MQVIQAQSAALRQNYASKPSPVLSRHRVLADFAVVAGFVIIGLLLSLYLMLFWPWSEEISAALSTLS
jgi:hypothetical protein